MREETFISVDIEADGPVPGMHSMLSLGACVAGEPERSFYVELRPISDDFVPEALAVSGLDRRRLFDEGTPPADAMASFRIWVASVAGNARPVFVSFSSWDWVFVYYYLIRFGGASPFGHASLDIKSFYLGRCGGSWVGTGKRSIAKTQPELLRGLGPHTHHALDDAREQGELFRRILTRAVGPNAEQAHHG
ncbi:MAG: 3'-5' exonuclease [Chloroflexota bacterium]